MKSITIQKGPSSSYPLIGFSMDATRPDSQFPTLEKELNKLAYKGVLLMDLLATNGRSNRFVSVEFDGQRIQPSSVKRLKTELLDEVTLNFCQAFYQKNSKKLSNTILSVAVRSKLSAKSK